MKHPIEIYRGADGQAQVEVRFGQETVWLSQAQMAQVFDTSTDNISLHLKNIFAEQELDEAATTEDFSVVRQEGQRTVNRRVKHYSLDAVLSVGYRVRSRHATQFRIWATARLKDYLLKGYALNHQRLQQNAAELEQALELIRKTAASPELTVASGRGLVDIVSRYTQTFLWLQQYDEGLLNDPPGQDGGVLPTIAEARAAGQSGTERVWRSGLPQRGKQSRASAVFCGQEPPFHRWQQAQRRLLVCRLSKSQRPLAQCLRPTYHQRYRSGRAHPAGG